MGEQTLQDSRAALSSLLQQASSGSRAGKLNTFLDSLAQGQKRPKMATLLVGLAAKVGGSDTHGWVLIP